MAPQIQSIMVVLGTLFLIICSLVEKSKLFLQFVMINVMTSVQFSQKPFDKILPLPYDEENTIVPREALSWALFWELISVVPPQKS